MLLNEAEGKLMRNVILLALIELLEPFISYYKR